MAAGVRGDDGGVQLDMRMEGMRGRVAGRGSLEAWKFRDQQEQAGGS